MKSLFSVFLLVLLEVPFITNCMTYIFNFFSYVIQIHYGMNVLMNYFRTPFLLWFICVEFRVLAFCSFTMFTCAMEFFFWILIRSFIIFISYSSAVTSFSSCDNDEKLLILATKMDGGLAMFSIFMLLF